MIVLIDLIENQAKETQCIHIHSDHTASLTKQLSWSIEKYLLQLSSSKDIFYKTTLYYEQRFPSCGYNKKITYQQLGENNKNSGKNQKRNTIWFNPPYSTLLKTSIGK